MTSPIVLRIFKENKLVSVKQLTLDQVVFGHNAEVNIDLEGEGIAPIHAIIEKRDDKYFLCDLGSQSGTFKNGEAVLDDEIVSGDEILIGDFKIQFYRGIPKPSVSPSGAPPKKPTKPPPGIAAGVLKGKENESVKLGDVPSFINKDDDELVLNLMDAEAKDSDLDHKIEDQNEKIVPINDDTPFAYKKQSEHEDRESGSFVARSLKGTYAPKSSFNSITEVVHPSRGGTLEIAMAWNERVIQTYHYSEPGKIYIGSDPSCDIYVPGYHQKKTQLVLFDREVTIVLTPEMKVDSVQGDKVQDLSRLMAQNRVIQQANFHILHLNQDELVRITLVAGGLSLLIRYVPTTSKPLLAPPLHFSASELTGIVITLVLISIFALYMYLYAPSMYMDDSDKDQIRIAEFEWEVPKIKKPSPPPPPPPKKIEPPPPVEPQKVQVTEKKVQQAPIKKKFDLSKGEKTKKAPGQARNLRPIPKSENKPKKFTSVKEGGAVNTGSKGANTESRKKDVSKMGLFSAFGGGGTRKQLDKAYSGSGELLGMADQSTGRTGFDTSRAGDDLGSKFKSTGRGGTGTSTVGIAGLGTKGRGSGHAGYGSGGGLGGKSSVVVETGGIEEEFHPSIDREAVRRVVRSNLNQLRACYERELNRRNARLSGKIVVTWEFGEHGRVLKARVSKTTLNNAGVESCVVSRLRAWRFPEPPPGIIAEVSYPFVFSSGN